MLPDRTTVLIVGAGPAGLATALSLLHHGVHDFVIVDAEPRGENSSRAGIIHAATLEALDTIGCGDDIASQGTKSTMFSIGTRSTKLISPSIESLKPFTRHPYMLVIPQSLTERTLEKKLASFGVTVHRPLKVVGLKRSLENPQFSDVTFEGGKVVIAKYVIGADGARSVVRASAGISFSSPMPVESEGETNLAQMVVADVTFDSTLAEGRTLGRSTVSEKVYRIACGVPLEEGEIPHAPPKEYLQNLVDRFGPYCLSSDPAVNLVREPTHINNVVWSSRFRNHASIADTFFTRLGGEGGVVLLVGDAAHVHSPTGGQGMNLGLRDAVFLGETIPKHIRATETGPLAEADAVLRSFVATRHVRALEVIKLAENISWITGMKYRERLSWWFPVDSVTVRDWVLWLLGNIPFVRRLIAWELSGLGRR